MIFFFSSFYSHRKCTNLIRDVPLKSTQSNKRGLSGEGGREEGRGREEGEGEREGEDEERVNDFPCSYRFSSSSFQETVKRGRWRSLTAQASSYTPQQDKR